MLAPTTCGSEDAAGGVERVDRRVDAEFGDLARENRVASRWAKAVAGAGSVRSSAGT